MVSCRSAPGRPSWRSSSRITRPTALTSICVVPAVPRSTFPSCASTPILPIWNFGICNSGSGSSQLAQVIVADRTDIADDMGEIRAQRIDAAEARPRAFTPGRAGALTATSARSSQLSRSAMVTGTKGERRTISRRARSRSSSDQRHDPGQPGQHLVDVAGIFAHHDDAVVLLVLGQDHAVAVEDQAARRWDQAHVDAVLLGQQAELVGLFDLHVAHPKRQCGDHRRLRAAQDQPATGDPADAFLGILRGAFHRGRPIVSISPGVILRMSNSTRDNRTISG